MSDLVKEEVMKVCKFSKLDYKSLWGQRLTEVGRNIEKRVREEVGFQVLCRKCKQPMKQAPLGVLAFYCHKCNVKAIINYSKIPIVEITEKELLKEGDI